MITVLHEASVPPEARGLARDGVRLAVATPSATTHAVARDLPSFLSPGDLLVVNTSATVPSASIAVCPYVASSPPSVFG